MVRAAASAISREGAITSNEYRDPSVSYAKDQQCSQGVNMANRPYPSFLIYVDVRGEFRWRYQASNTKTIADSGEGYKNLADCEHGIELVKSSRNSEIWETEDVTKRRR